MRVVFVVAVLAAGCAPRARQVPAVAPAAAPDPKPPELAEAEAAFRAQDREIGDLLAGSAPLACYQLVPLDKELGRLGGKICQLTNTREGERYRTSGSCRYVQERSVQLNRAEARRGCRQREKFIDPGFPRQ